MTNDSRDVNMSWGMTQTVAYSGIQHVPWQPTSLVGSPLSQAVVGSQAASWNQILLLTPCTSPSGGLPLASVLSPPRQLAMPFRVFHGAL